MTLVCDNLNAGYKSRAVLSGINLEFTRGNFISLLGPNGAGKTTLLRTLSRHLDPVAGSINLAGRPLAAIRAGELARIMAVVLTDKVTPPLFTAFEFAALGRYPHTGFLGRFSPHDLEVVEQALVAVSAEDLAQRQFTDLSDGERQKVLVARALAQEPEVLLLDEPTAHLDLKHRLEVMSILRNLCTARGLTVIASLHDVDIAAKVSDTVALIKDGGVMCWGAPEEVLDSNTVARLYDFESACFDHRLGSVELRGVQRYGRVFVIGGMGRGATVFRILAKCGYGISTGVVFENDLDCYVARSLGAHCTSQKPSDSIGQAALGKAITEMEQCDWVIDTGIDGGVYAGNMVLLEKALAGGKQVFRLAGGPDYSPDDMKAIKVTQLDRPGDIPQALI